MTNVINVELAFDSEAHVWYVKRSDVLGLRIEADTVDALIARIPDALRDLLGDGDTDGARCAGGSHRRSQHQRPPRSRVSDARGRGCARRAAGSCNRVAAIMGSGRARPHGRFTVDGKIMSRHTANGTLVDAGLDKAF